eukprot:1160333-Pelagomonas_calceolata.AAC.4
MLHAHDCAHGTHQVHAYGCAHRAVRYMLMIVHMGYTGAWCMLMVARMGHTAAMTACGAAAPYAVWRLQAQA